MVKYLANLKATKEYFLKAEQDGKFCMAINNSHTSTVDVSILMNSEGGESIAIFTGSLNPGEQAYLNGYAINANMAIGGIASVGSVVSIKVDLE